MEANTASTDFSVQAINDLLGKYERERSDRSRTWRDRAESRAFQVGIYLTATSAGCALLKRFFGYNNAIVYGLTLLQVVGGWLGFLGVMAPPVIAMLATLLKLKEWFLILKYPVQAALPLASVAQRDYELSVKLSAYDEASLRFMANRMHVDAESVRSHVGLVIGSIERIGAFPAAVALGLTVWGLWPTVREGKAPITAFTLIEAAAILVIFFILGMSRISASRRVDELAGIIEFAADRRKPVDSANTLSSAPIEVEVKVVDSKTGKQSTVIVRESPVQSEHG